MFNMFLLLILLRYVFYTLQVHFINGKLTENSKPSIKTQYGINEIAESDGYEQCKQKIFLLVDTHGESAVRNKLKKLVFRRVYSVNNFQLDKILYYTKPDEYTKIETIEFLSDQEIEKNVEFRCRDYYGWSSKTTLRKPFPEMSIELIV